MMSWQTREQSHAKQPCRTLSPAAYNDATVDQGCGFLNTISWKQILNMKQKKIIKIKSEWLSFSALSRLKQGQRAGIDVSLKFRRPRNKAKVVHVIGLSKTANQSHKRLLLHTTTMIITKILKILVLKMWGHWNCHMLSAEPWRQAATVERSLTVPQKSNGITTWPSNSTPVYVYIY